MSGYSIVEYVGESNDGKCGYCKKTGNYNSTGFWAHSLNVGDYQDLINRNWRRSGQYCYLPKNRDTCCPMYTIKCDATNFQLNKSHKKILKRMNKFLRDGIKDHGQQHESMASESHEPKPSKERSDLQLEGINLSSLQHGSDLKANVNKPDAVVSQVPEKKKSVASIASDSNGSDKPSNPKKAKLIRLERKKEKLAAKGLSLSDVQPKTSGNVEKSLEDFLNEEPKDGKHRLEVRKQGKCLNFPEFPFNSSAGKTCGIQRRNFRCHLQSLQEIPNSDPPRPTRKAFSQILRAISGHVPVKGKLLPQILIIFLFLSLLTGRQSWCR